MSLIAALCVTGTLLGGPPGGLPRVVRTFSFEHDAILGTSLDLTFAAPSEESAQRAETVALAEIDRLRRVLSSYDAGSELSILMTQGVLSRPSAELTTVLGQYDLWHSRSAGAYTARVAPLTALWRAGEALGVLPDSAALARVVTRIAGPAWNLDARSGSLRLLTSDRIDLNSLGKGYIIDHAVAAVRREVPEVVGGIINLGGDIASWGANPEGGQEWLIGVADPRSPADNAAPLTVLRLRDRAISSSGSYARGFFIAGQHYSHIIDPRTGQPADVVSGTTVIAPDNTTANALATTLSVLSPEEGLALASSLPGVEALIVGADGKQHRTAGFSRHEVAPAPRPAAGPLKATVTIDITPQRPNRHRPYVAVWVTDTNGKLLKTLAFWGTKAKYIRELSKWYEVAKPTQTLISAVTRATRAVGEYTLEWDGLAEDDTPVTLGTVLFWFEESFENGAHSLRSTKVACLATPGTGTFEPTSAFAGGTVTCSSTR